MSARESNFLGALSLATAERVRDATAAAAPHSGETPAGLVALATFMGGASIEALSQVLGLSHSATVRLVDKLENGGLVERREAADARAVAVVLIRAGTRVADQIQHARMEALDELLSSLSARERGELARLHEKLLTGLVATGAKRGQVCRLCDAEACGHEVGRCQHRGRSAASFSSSFASSQTCPESSA